LGRTATLRKRISRILYNKFAWDRGDLAEAVDIILRFTNYVHPDHRFDVVPADPDDNRVLECAVRAGSQVIVTGDTDLRMLRRFGTIRIQTVSDFLDAFRASGP
jgi:predicted nucleic acid-binding protein